MARLGAKLPFDLTSCPSTGLDSFDLVIAERDLLLKEPADRVIALMEAVNRNVLAPLAVLTAAELARARDREQTRGERGRDACPRKGSPGFGVVAVRNGSTVLCKVVSSDHEAHAAVLVGLEDRLRDEISAAPSTTATSAEGAFLSAKRGQCGLVYASGTDFAALLDGLQRDQIPSRLTPIWVTPEALA